HLQTASDITARRRDLIARLETRRAVLGAGAAKLDYWAIRCGEVGNPDVIVAVNRRSPGTWKTTAHEWRTREFAAIRSQKRDAATFVSSSLLEHRPRQHLISVSSCFEGQDRFYHHGRSTHGVSQTVCHPDVSPAVNSKPAAAVAGSEFLDLSRIGVR